jgi:hypothetical protein
MTGMCHNTQLFFIMWYPELFTEAGLKLWSSWEACITSINNYTQPQQLY